MNNFPSDASETALRLAHTLRDPETVTAHVSTRAAPTLCYGLAGTALLHACLAHADHSAAAAAGTHWDQALRLTGQAPPDGIHTGPGALAASLIVGTGYLPDSTPHHDRLPRATAWLAARACALAHHHHRRSARGEGTPWAVYDAIKGLSGIGRVLLAAHHRGYITEAAPGLHATLDALTHMILTSHGNWPGWFLPAADHPPTVEVHPSGAATTGLAHGIAGPLALLALAHTAEEGVPGQAEAIRAAASWLLKWQEPGGTWPPYISGEALDADPDQASAGVDGRRNAWCYGTPGISSALTAAGHALNDISLIGTGADALAGLAACPTGDWDTTDDALCHGRAGVLQAATRHGNSSLANRAAQAIQAVSGDAPGFLTGAAGTALALADYGGLLPPGPPADWDCILLLS